MSKTGWIIFCAVIALLLGGLIGWTRLSNPPLDLSNVAIHSVLDASSDSGDIADHAKGASDGKVILFEYGDYQCPACSATNQYVNQLVEEYGDKFTFVFRNFPLTSIHPNAKAAAAAVEAAGKQGKFWEMHDTLYNTQTSWSSLDSTKRADYFKQTAASLGLSVDTFVADVESSSVTKKIAYDQAIGRTLNVDATPTFYLNGTKLDEETAGTLSRGDLSGIKAKIDELRNKQ